MNKSRRTGKLIESKRTQFATAMAARSGSLDPADWDSFREQAHRMLDDMLGSMETLREQPVWQPIPQEVRARFEESMPEAASSLSDVHQEFLSSIVPYTARNAHPGFMGWAQGGGTAVGMMAEMLAAGLNANAGGRDQMPLDVERQITKWMRTLFGFPEGANGLFVTGTSMANLLAVAVARQAALGKDVRRTGIAQAQRKLSAYACTNAHGSITRALELTGIGADSLRMIAEGDQHQMDLTALEAAIIADQQAGFTPFLVVGTAGSVDTGAIDDLAAIADICRAHNIWFHVDGAYGALGMLAADIAPHLEGIEHADSLAFDFHKWGQVPYDAGFLLVRDGAMHLETFASSSAYLAREERGMSAGDIWPCDLGIDLSRSFRALKTWMTFKVYGAEAIGAAISRTCALAKRLQSMIAATPELELMAPVRTNIVCFRYRLSSTGKAPAANSEHEELCNKLNREIVIRLQEAGVVAPSTTTLHGHVVIRAAIVNHRTDESDITTLVQAVLAEGRALMQTEPYAQNPKTWEPWSECAAKVRKLDSELNSVTALVKETEIALRSERANLLTAMGRDLEAQSDYLKVLELDSTHLSTLIDFGRLLISMGKRKAAQMVYLRAVSFHPDDLVCRVNLAGTLLEEHQPAAAREHYEAALRLAPGFPQAHCGMYYVLSQLGEPEAAEQHRREGFGRFFITPRPYRGEAKPISLLLLVSSTGGIAPIEKLIDDRIFQVYVVVADFYDVKVPLPEHQLIVNAIGDVDVSDEALLATTALLARTKAPLLNLPDAVRLTSREHNAKRLACIPGVRTAKTETFAYADLASGRGVSELDRRGFGFPLLLRAPGFHMGQHFVRVESPGALADAVREIPLESQPEAKLLAMEYLDARGTDSMSRKYRVMMIDGELHPLHLAISPNWKVHYFSADMADRPDHREEEARFLVNMPEVLGEKAMRALAAIQTELGLDYAGIDFGLNADGDVLLFETNATMVVEMPNDDPRWDYRRTAIRRIQNAVHDMLLKTAKKQASPTQAITRSVHAAA